MTGSAISAVFAFRGGFLHIATLMPATCHPRRIRRLAPITPVAASGKRPATAAPDAKPHCHPELLGSGCRTGQDGREKERGMSKPGLDNRHRNKDGEISHKHGNTLIGTLRKIYGVGFAAGYPATEKLSEILLQLNETSLSQLRRDHETGHLEHKIANASK
jgi:hypothetical protein